ncbi:hypothetical protein A2U01_0009368, partial [Trifolium medium]|nr:hypothetical protein [Trifolium medium]
KIFLFSNALNLSYYSRPKNLSASNGRAALEVPAVVFNFLLPIGFFGAIPAIKLNSW